jgi:succinyl-CoA synthetase alpha subunit
MSILVNADTTFIVQGITGREAVNLTRECLDYGKGAKIVGGVTPGRRGRTSPSLGSARYSPSSAPSPLPSRSLRPVIRPPAP